MTLSTQTPGNQTLKRGDGFIFHDVFGRVAVDRGNDDIRDPEGNRTVPICGCDKFRNAGDRGGDW